MIERPEFEALFGTPSGIEPERLAAAYAIPHRRIESLDELAEAAASGTGVIEVRTARRRNVEVHRRIAGHVADAIARPA
jgi:2-succinyl-5-enolpyruvyl-6-hydroxy-3-cyclohexene-1-carboxylate synthase